MRFELTIDCNGAAFDPDPTHEVAALLLSACQALREAPDLREGIRLVDVNGNGVGWATFDRDDEEGALNG